jgi:hypothetical protein
VTAYQLTPVGAEGVEGHRTEVIDIPTRAEMYQQIEQLRDELERARTHAANEGQWKAVAQRRAAECRAVLRELASRSPEAARTVASAKAKVRRAGTWTS